MEGGGEGFLAAAAGTKLGVNVDAFGLNTNSFAAGFRADLIGFSYKKGLLIQGDVIA
jgi:hypothetical protein